MFTNGHSVIDKKLFTKRALELASEDGRQLGTRLAREFGISRAAASSRLRALVREGLLEAEGATRSRTYHLAVIDQTAACYPTEGLSEDRVWRELCLPVVADLPGNVLDIWNYGVTEMVNNAIDHSGSPVVEVSMNRTALHTECTVRDWGEGIFHKIQRALELYDPREAILELAKGKFTTDPERHTGEGIFFSSKLFDRFHILSGRLAFVHEYRPDDMILETDERETEGTAVFMSLRNDSVRNMKEVMDQYAAPEEYTFSRTIIPIRLAVHEGEKLVSRSQAKRITFRIERFENVVLDFDGVEEIGQAFADEIFRVFRRNHPGVNLTPINMSPQVEAMVRRAESSA